MRRELDRVLDQAADVENGQLHLGTRAFMLSDRMAEGSLWEPILDGADADAAWQAIRDVARAIGDGHGTRRRPADLALFWAYAAGALDDDWTNARYEEAVDHLCSWISEGTGGRSLFGGLAGSAWVLSHISDDGGEVLGQIDALMLEAAEESTRMYDLIGGLVGDGVYFLERLASGDAPVAQRGLEVVVDRLIAAGQPTASGLAWFTPRAALPPQQQPHAPDGYFNCGLAHGAPGPIALFGRAATCAPRAEAACKDALGWLAAQQLPPDPNGRFPAWVLPDGSASSTRTAWCYGDPGVAIAAWSASVRLGLPADSWRTVARETATRDPERCGVIDAGMCHGAAGLGHIYNRYFQASRDPVFRDAARVWFRRALALRRPDGLGGFAAWSALGGEGNAWAAAADLVEGASGVALALLAAVHPSEPNWDRLFLCDLPPIAAGG
jgi:hypothetical protein